MFIKNGSYQLKYPVKLYNLYNLKEEDYKLLFKLFYKEKDLKKLCEKIVFLSPDIKKVGLEKVYLNILMTRKIGGTKIISPRQLLKAGGYELRLFDKNILRGHETYISLSWVNDKEVAKKFMTKEYLIQWIEGLKKESRPFCINYLNICSKPFLFWFVTMIMIHGNPY